MAFVAGHEILTIVYKSEYANSADLFIWLMVAAAVSYMASLLGYGMTAAPHLFSDRSCRSSGYAEPSPLYHARL